MGRSRRILIATRFLFLLAIPAATPAAAATFDGAWSVRIASSSSACGNGATASIDISNGRVASNDAMMTASGRVAEGGRNQRHANQRHEARGWLRSPHGHLGFRHLARRPMPGNVDRAADLVRRI